MKTPNYMLSEAIEFYYNSKSVKLEPGTFIRPIEKSYLPKHVFSDERWKGYRMEKYTFCYTRLGIIPIETAKIRQVD